MPVVGLTSFTDDWKGTVTLSFNATGFSTTSAQNGNGYERGVSYLSVKMNVHLPSVSDTGDTYWVTRGALLLADSFEDVWPEPWNNGVFMETIYKNRPGAGTKYIMTLSRVTPKELEFQALRLIILEWLIKISFLLSITYFNTSDSILATHSTKVSSYALQSSILHSQIKILGTSPKKFGDFLWIFEFIHYLCCVNQLKQ